MLRTSCLELGACTLELARAEAAGPQSLAAALNVTVPPHWPPPLNDEHSQRWVREQLPLMTPDQQRDPARVAGPLAGQLAERLMARLDPMPQRETVLGR